MTVAQARQNDCPVPLPDSARNVQFASAFLPIGPAFEIAVRFEAPPKEFQAWVQSVCRAQPGGTLKTSVTLSNLSGSQCHPDLDMFRDTTWFDLERISHCTSAVSNEPGSAIQFWVDNDRGVFFCTITD